MTFVVVVLLVFVMICIADGVICFQAFKQKSDTGRLMGITLISSLVLTVSYLISIFVENELLYSLFSAIYFAGVDFTVFFLLQFIGSFVNNKKRSEERHWLWYVGRACLCADVAVQLLNPFLGWSIRYIHRDTVISHYTYSMQPLYVAHLVFDYLLVITALYMLVKKTLSVPKAYRSPYILSILVIVIVVGINALYLYIPGPAGYDFLDYSLAGYSVAGFMLYLLCFGEPSKRLYAALYTWIYENVNQGIVLFDHENRLVMHNQRASRMLPKGALEECLALETFAERCGFRKENVYGTERRSFQYYVNDGRSKHSMRCDRNVMLSRRGQVMSRLFVFSDLSTEIDVLTGFYNWDYFKNNVDALCDAQQYVVAACDINGLSDINHVKGHEVGDQAIQLLADGMSNAFPKDTCFVRGHEAILIAICPNLSVEEAHRCLEKVNSELVHTDLVLSLQSIVCNKENSTTPVETIRRAMRSLRTKKLLDKNSIHSVTLNSLIQALKECDNDTESHVQRTQHMAGLLGTRIGLTDEEMNNLALLAVLHDIGKIGIPLEILNKPSKLNDSEWALMKTHTEKGYQIASSSPELRDIADMILYHHERWDGKGYPDGLSKESIPLLSRIISVVDSYDAMISDRPYHRGMPIAAARQELKRNAGTQFDPSIVSAFLAVLDELDAQSGVSATEADQPVSAPAEDRVWSSNNPRLQIQAAKQVHVLDYCTYLLEADMTILPTDQHFEELTGYSREDVAEHKLTQLDLLPEEDREGYIQKVSELMKVSDSCFLEHRIHRKDGQVIYVHCYGTQYFDSSVRKMRTRIVVNNVANSYAFKTTAAMENNRAERRLRQWEDKYRRDPLTGLLNHEAFRSDVEHELLSGNKRALMLMVDVDHFKEYNDEFGHHAGDEYLLMVARNLTKAIREDDLACRMGGDEFAAVLFYNGDVESIMVERAQRIFDKINMSLSAQAGHVASVSIGGAFTSENVSTFDQLYQAADQALYRAKRSGRARLSM